MALLLVENQEKGPTVWADHVWAPKGDPNGDDILRLPDTLLDDPGFLSALAAGHLSLLDPPDDVSERMAQMRIGDRSALRRDRAAGAEESVLATIDRRHDRDLVGYSCLGPGSRGQAGACGTQVLRRNVDADQAPPLCGRHGHLADRFMLVRAPGRPATWNQVSTQ